MVNMGDMMRQVQQMQSKMAQMQEELALKTVTGSSGGGMVRVVCSGKQEILSMEIDPAVVDPADLELLQDLLTAAVNDAIRNSKELVEKEMKSLTGGLSIPGLF